MSLEFRYEEKLMLDALNRILDWHTARQRPVADLLQEGIEIDCKEFDDSLMFTSEIKTLYQWHNGTALLQQFALNQLSFVPGYYLLSFLDSIHYYKSFHQEDYWESGWFPILANGGGDFYVATCNVENKQYSPVINFLRGESDQVIEYLSVTNMFLVAAECFERGIYYLDENVIKVDIKTERSVAHRYNPDLSRWQK